MICLNSGILTSVVCVVGPLMRFLLIEKERILMHAVPNKDKFACCKAAMWYVCQACADE
jgi:hypothetical protein